MCRWELIAGFLLSCDIWSLELDGIGITSQETFRVCSRRPYISIQMVIQVLKYEVGDGNQQVSKSELACLLETLHSTNYMTWRWSCSHLVHGDGSRKSGRLSVPSCCSSRRHPRLVPTLSLTIRRLVRTTSLTVRRLGPQLSYSGMRHGKVCYVATS